MIQIILYRKSMRDLLQAIRQPGSVLPVELDALLGDAGGRYFGSGYRRVRYGSPADVEFRHDGTLRANVAVRYPAGWSTGAGGAPRAPHLSTLDAVILPIIVFDRVISELGSSTGKLHVAAARLRSGPVPWTDLASVPVAVSVNGNEAGPWEITGTVGNMKVLIRLQGSLDLRKRPTIEPLAPAATVYGGAFRHAMTSSRLMRFEPDSRTLIGEHRTRWDAKHSRIETEGVESAWRPALTVIDHLAVMGQMAQSVIALSADSSRESMGTLWMRAVDIETAEEPAAAPVTWMSRMTLVRDRELRSDGVHDVRVQSTASTGVIVRASLAYTRGPSA